MEKRCAVPFDWSGVKVEAQCPKGEAWKKVVDCCALFVIMMGMITSGKTKNAKKQE